MSCADVQTIQAGNGSKTQFSFDFPYIFKSEIQVSFWNTTTKEWDVIAQGDATYPWQVTDANPTIVEFTSTAPPAPAVPVDPGETSVDNVRIRRVTNIDDIRALFNPGSAIRSDDLNKNFEQLRYAIQEANCQGITDDVDQFLRDYYWDRFDNTIYEADTWVSNDTKIATTAAIDARFQDELSETIESTETWVSDDDHIATTAASDDQYTTLVQVTTPLGSDWPVGKTWLQNDINKTLSIWNGSAWVAVASGGSFTELPKVVYVDAVNGDDNLLGHRISNPKRTIKAAIEQINAETDDIGNGSVVILAPGIYGEEFPIDIQKNDVSIVGTSLRNCIIHPAIPTADQAGYSVDVPHANELSTMFRVNSGTYIAHLTMSGMKASGTRGGNAIDTDATYGLPTNQGWNIAFYPGAVIRKSPYIQNCTNFSDSQINNVNFTPHVPGEGSAGDLDSAPSGGGILIDGSTVASNSPLRSMVCDSYTHTALDGPGIFVTNNGYCQATSSYAFFCHYHLKTKNGGQANLAASTSDFGRYSLIADGRSTTAIFTAVTTVNATAGDITFTIGTPTPGAVWHGSATRPQDNMLVDIGGNTYPILSSVPNGSGWDVTISRPNPSNLSENLGLEGNVASGGAVSFFLRSMIASSGHTMEYVGSGTDYRALPENGGVPDSTAQLVELNRGKIWAATTDHKGTFNVGSTFSVNQQTGFISLSAGSFEIPSLLANLNLNGYNIYDSEGDVTINGQMDISGFKITNVADPTSAQHVATKNYVDTNFVNTTDIGVTVQPYDANLPAGNTILVDGDIGVTVQAYDATYLKSADIGVTVQGYDADTVKQDVLPTFTVATRTTERTITSGAFDLSTGNLWTVGAITVPNPTNAVSGQTGAIRITAGPVVWSSNFKFPGATAPTIASFPAIIPYYVQDSSTILMGNVTEGIA
jgi:hypothetical protein